MRSCRQLGRKIRLPQRIVFVGGGCTAFEFGYIAPRAGAAVTIVHQGARPLEHFDKDLVARLVERRGPALRPASHPRESAKGMRSFVVGWPGKCR